MLKTDLFSCSKIKKEKCFQLGMCLNPSALFPLRIASNQLFIYSNLHSSVFKGVFPTEIIHITAHSCHPKPNNKSSFNQSNLFYYRNIGVLSLSLSHKVQTLRSESSTSFVQDVLSHSRVIWMSSQNLMTHIYGVNMPLCF